MSMKHKYVRGEVSRLLQESRESYYWAGFLAADGSINHKTWRLRLSLAVKDADHLKQFAQFVECPNIHYYSKRAIYVTVQDKFYVSLLAQKFNFRPRKKENPPESIQWMTDEMFIAWLIGFIDGDGCVRKQSNGRRDAQIQIKLHGNWLQILEQCAKRLGAIAGFSIPAARINNRGYARLILSRSEVLRLLKEYTLDLPVLKRKWDNVDENFVSRCQLATSNKPTLIELWKKGLTAWEIADTLGIGVSCVYNTVWREGLATRQEQTRRRIVDLRRRGFNQAEIAKEIGCCQSNISRTLSRIRGV